MDSLSLTTAEAEIITMIFNGLPASEIAKARGTTPWTVKQQLHRIYLKAGVHNSLELVAKAYRQGGFLW